MQYLNEIAKWSSALPMGLLLFMFVWLRGVEKKLGTRTEKIYADNTFMRQDLYNRDYKETKEDIKEIKGDVKELLRRNGGQRDTSRKQ